MKTQGTWIIIDAAERECWRRWGGVNCKAVAVAVAEGIQPGERVTLVRYVNKGGTTHNWVSREGDDLVAYTDDVEISRETIGTPAGDRAYAEALVAKAVRAGRVFPPGMLG